VVGRHDTKTTYQVEIRYANNTNETFTFHGPPGERSADYTVFKHPAFSSNWWKAIWEQICNMHITFHAVVLPATTSSTTYHYLSCRFHYSRVSWICDHITVYGSKYFTHQSALLSRQFPRQELKQKHCFHPVMGFCSFSHASGRFIIPADPIPCIYVVCSKSIEPYFFLRKPMKRRRLPSVEMWRGHSCAVVNFFPPAESVSRWQLACEWGRVVSARRIPVRCKMT
jgi:hypothetical protein